MPKENNRLLHTMMRVKNLEESIKFYCGLLGMEVLRKKDYPGGKFTNCFIGFGNEDSHTVLELTHNWGDTAESVDYHNGNSEPKGFGHIGFHVPNADAACKRFESLGVPFQKGLNDGSMKGIAFIKDPDGYWIEIFDADKVADTCAPHLKK